MLLLNKKLDLTVHTYVPTNEITKSQFIFIGIIKYAEGIGTRHGATPWIG